MIDIYREAAARLAAGQNVALAEIVENQGSTPREAGAQMIVWRGESGAAGVGTAGTVGGGRLEAEVIQKACACIDMGKEGVLHPFALSGEDAAEMDMICGGSGVVMVTLLTARDREAMDAACAAIKERRRAWLVTLLEGESARTAYVDDSKDPISGAGLSDAQEALVLDCAGPAMHSHDDESITVRARLLSAGPLLYIFGGGHVGCETALVCNQIGFETLVVDDREEFVSVQRFPWSRRIVAGTEEELAAVSGLTFDEQIYVLIMSRGHLLDYQWLRWILALPAMPKYVGMIGSRRKIKMIYDRLEQDGIDKDRISRVFAPVGLSIGAQTPEEIAVCIAAQLIQVRSGKLED